MKRLFFVVVLLLSGLEAYSQVQWGPWVTEAREKSLTILWVSEQPGMAWVDLNDGTRVWETFAGRRIFGRLHQVHLEGLEPGSAVNYRVGGQNLKDDSHPKDPVFAEETYQGAWQEVHTLSRKAAGCRFSVVNDIHLRTDKYSALAGQVSPVTHDFVFLNGDIVSAGNYCLDTLVRYEVAPLGDLAARLPVFFARGNHEGRGNNPTLVADIFPNRTPAPFYYTFRQGPVAFLVLDAGETGRSRSILYSGGPVYEDYLQEQLKWARKAVLEPSFLFAKVKICIVHVPMIDHPDKTDFLLQRWLNEHFVKFLNHSGIDLMIGADLHEFMYCEPGTMGNKFPILVNDDARRLEVFVGSQGIILQTWNAEGEKEFEKVIE